MTRAFPLAGDANYPEPPASGSRPWPPRLLYYTCFPRSNFRRMWRKMLDAGITPPFAADDVENLGTPDEDVTTVLDVSAFVDIKVASLNCHRTQISSTGPFALLPQETLREIMSTEHYTLAFPEGADKGMDLLAGLR
jgi:LmbE family N-acetylglucosaminyl deacetylase